VVPVRLRTLVDKLARQFPPKKVLLVNSPAFPSSKGNLGSKRSSAVAKVPPETLELGYVAVDPGHQGRQLSSRIAALLVSQYKGRLFVTTYHDRMKRTLARTGFVQKGNQWKSKNEKDMLSFWEKE